jgi:hypothetical protein
MLQLRSLSCWINQFRIHAGKVTANNQLAASSVPAGTAATAPWHGFQWPVCIVPPTFQQKVVVQCPLSRSPPRSGSSGQPVLRGTSASAHEQTYGRRPGALCPPARAADYPGHRGSLRRRHAVARWGQAARGADAANIDRGKWGQNLYQIPPGRTSRSSAQTAIWSSPPCVGSAVRFSASMSWTAMAPSHPGRTSQAHQQKPWVSQPPPRLLLLRPRSPPVAQTPILSPRRNGDAETGRSHTCSNPSVLTRLEGT